MLAWPCITFALHETLDSIETGFLPTAKMSEERISLSRGKLLFADSQCPIQEFKLQEKKWQNIPSKKRIFILRTLIKHTCAAFKCLCGKFCMFPLIQNQKFNTIMQLLNFIKHKNKLMFTRINLNKLIRPAEVCQQDVCWDWMELYCT